IRDVTAKQAKYALYVRGFPNDPVRDISLEHCAFTNVANHNVLENVDGLKLAGVTINGKKADV
ncbi:MAG: glycoside hydrolase family 28 protein, partial [Acidobacteriia bacterium]|nr:glycoside hydrolase family 28 protein [Terriglobia bacterium]